jgi:hypothetical protein
MALARREQKTTAVERLSTDDTVRALVVKRFDTASSLMPKKIEGTFDQPKVREVILAAGEESVLGFVEFELIKLAERINVSGNLSDGQIQFIASQLVGMFPNETLSDFKLCFERASMGAYGKVFKLDGIEIGSWMGKYLDEKYQVLETQLMKEKDYYNDNVKKSSTDWLQLWKEAVEKTEVEGVKKPLSANLEMLTKLRQLTDKEILQEGQEKPEYKPYPKSSVAKFNEIEARMREGRRRHFLEQYPSASEDDINRYLDSFPKQEFI